MSFPADLLKHPAVTNFGRGVSSADLASLHEAVMSEGQIRIVTVGHEQYANGEKQKFETRSPEQAVMELVEEIADAQVYITMALARYLHQISKLIPEADAA